MKLDDIEHRLKSELETWMPDVLPLVEFKIEQRNAASRAAQEAGLESEHKRANAQTAAAYLGTAKEESNP